VTDVIHASGGEVIQQNDAIAASKQSLGEMRTDKTGAAGN
jgi:hypothetical protein